MRDNGLTAATYTSMGGIDPLVTTPVLTALAEAGIAAYSTVPAPADQPPAGGSAADGSTATGGSAATGADAERTPTDDTASTDPTPADTPPATDAARADAADESTPAPTHTPAVAEDAAPAPSAAPANTEPNPADASRIDHALGGSSPGDVSDGTSPDGGSAPAGDGARAERPVAERGADLDDADRRAGPPRSAEKAGGPADQPEVSAAEESAAKAPAKTEASPADAKGRARKLPPGFEEIFVDSAAVERARAVIDRSTEDAEWKSLVEQFNAPSAPGHDAPPVPRWPASEDVDENSYEPLIDVPAGLTARDTDEKPAEERPARRADDPHDHYIPPEPPRGPKLDWISRAAWFGLIGGPVLLILAAVLDFGTGRLTLLAVVGFMAGFLTLVIRMNDRLPPDDTPDDGAVV